MTARAYIIDAPYAWDFQEGHVFDYFGKVYAVVSPKRTKVLAMNLADGRNYNVDMQTVKKEDIRKPTAAEAKQIALYTTPESTENFQVGSPVTIKNKTLAEKIGYTTETLMVVFKAGDICNIVPIGGTNSTRYYRFSKNDITLVPTAEITRVKS